MKLLIILLCLLISLALLVWVCGRMHAFSYVGGGLRLKDLKKYPRSKFEAAVAKAFEDLTGKPFPTAYPSWLKYKNKSLELDGYNEELGIAFEAQGPLHTKFYASEESYKKYEERLEADREKIKLCEENNVKLIIVDHRVPRHLLREYIASRLYDIGYFDERPLNYIPAIEPEIYENPIYSAEAALATGVA